MARLVFGLGGVLGIAFASLGEAALLTAVVPSDMVDALQAKLTTSWHLVSESSAKARDLEEAVALVPSFDDRSRLPDMLAKLPHGKLLQIEMTGYAWLNMSTVPSRYTICNVHNSVVAIPEYVMAAILSWNARLPQQNADFRRCTWQSTDNTCKRPPRHETTRGKTLGIIGYGALGSGAGVMAAALGMRVVAVTKGPPSVAPPPLAWIADDSQLPRLMQESDFVLVTVPLFPSTVGLVSASALGHMKASGVLINVARGPIVDQAGLYEALAEGRIGGAVLDVWWQEMAWMNPLGNGPSAWPSKFNFSSLDNVWMTPHISYDTAEADLLGIEQVAENLQAFASSHQLSNVIRNASTSSVAPSAISV